MTKAPFYQYWGGDGPLSMQSSCPRCPPATAVPPTGTRVAWGLLARTSCGARGVLFIDCRWRPTCVGRAVDYAGAAAPEVAAASAVGAGLASLIPGALSPSQTYSRRLHRRSPPWQCFQSRYSCDLVEARLMPHCIPSCTTSSSCKQKQLLCQQRLLRHRRCLRHGEWGRLRIQAALAPPLEPPSPLWDVTVQLHRQQQHQGTVAAACVSARKCTATVTCPAHGAMCDG